MAINFGSSNAAKCPPLGGSLTLVRFTYFSFRIDTGWNIISSGNLAQAVGTVIGCLDRKLYLTLKKLFTYKNSIL